MSSGCESAAKLPAPGRAWPRLASALVLSGVAACASPEPGPVEFAVTAERVARAGCSFPYERCPEPAPSQLCADARRLAERASASVIAIDQRGHFAPVAFILPEGCAREPIRQPTPGINCEPQGEGPPVESFTDCLVEHAKQIRSRLASPPSGKRYHLLVFVHGGLNLEQGRLERAFVDANRMLAERRLAEAQVSAERRSEEEEIWYPLFVTWPSGGIQSYVDQRVHYNQGDYDSEFKRIFSPLYFLTDAVEAVVRAPVAWAESFSWVDLGQTPEVAEIGNVIGCEQSPHFGCVPVGRDDRPVLQEIGYWSPIGFVGRALTVPAVDVVGQPAWDAMLNHARMLMRKPFDDREFAVADGKLDGKGDLFHQFRVLRELVPAERPPVTLIGHSMGAIVVNDVLRSFPELPYRNVVFMGAAASVRETIAALDVVARTSPDAGLRFYNLSLHQDAEANEVGYFGTVSKGSLLEWVDRMYTTPATFADRTVGKWINAVMARGDFAALERPGLELAFKRFGLSCAEPLKHTEFDEYEPRPGCPDARRPYWDPAFWTLPEAPARG